MNLRGSALALASCAALAGSAACGTLPSAQMHFVGDEHEPVLAEGFAPCRTEVPTRVDLDPSEPLVVIVHGCNASGGAEFEELATVFEARGQQTVCFNYDHRRTLRATAIRFRQGFDRLRRRFGDQPITVLGHSQGGLVSRIALSELDDDEHDGDVHDTRLVTVSSPFAGIQSARHCGLPWLHVLSLGITVAVCQGIAGSNWVEIHPRSRYWTEPRPLEAGVADHLQIVTDEEGTCRVEAEDGSCEADDLVFTTAEQLNPALETDERVRLEHLAVGHSAVVGADARPLIQMLERHGVIAPVAADPALTPDPAEPTPPPETRAASAGSLNAR